MNRLEPVIEELEAARAEATSRFAAEAEMPVPDFQRHFRVVLDSMTVSSGEVAFRVEPKE
jgi:hypothetical protein